LPLVKKDKEKTIVEFIKCIEKNLFKESENIGSEIRNQSVPIIKSLQGIIRTSYSQRLIRVMRLWL